MFRTNVFIVLLSRPRVLGVFRTLFPLHFQMKCFIFVIKRYCKGTDRRKKLKIDFSFGLISETKVSNYFCCYFFRVTILENVTVNLGLKLMLKINI